MKINAFLEAFTYELSEILYKRHKIIHTSLDNVPLRFTLTRTEIVGIQELEDSITKKMYLKSLSYNKNPIEWIDI